MREQDRPILPVRVANGHLGFAQSCPLTELTYHNLQFSVPLNKQFSTQMVFSIKTA